MHFSITPQISLQAHWFTSLAVQHQHLTSSQQPKHCTSTCWPSPGRKSWVESSSKRVFHLPLQSEHTGRKKALRAWQTSVFRRWWWKKPGEESGLCTGQWSVCIWGTLAETSLCPYLWPFPTFVKVGYAITAGKEISLPESTLQMMHQRRNKVTSAPQKHELLSDKLGALMG